MGDLIGLRLLGLKIHEVDNPMTDPYATKMATLDPSTKKTMGMYIIHGSVMGMKHNGIHGYVKIGM